TSLPFLLAASAIGTEMGLLDPAVGAGLVAAGLVSVLVFPVVALALLPRATVVPAAG
ncbi:MAG: cation:proton antiporter, partial [Pseudonocardia sp.]|nr:cation:proton antiporter [Pseudonocardia sp.]